MDLLRQSGESLAGRIAYVDLAPLTVLEIAPGRADLERLWLRGGFPNHFLAIDDAVSLALRKDFIRTYLERDVPLFGPRLPAVTLERLWTMPAHRQGGLLNASELARALAVSTQTVTRYIDLLVDLLFYRTAAGAEIDLLLERPDGSLWAIEIKRALTARPRRGFHVACEDLKPARAFVVYAGEERYPVAAGVEAIGVREMAGLVAGA